mgnify:CR=1 FL=1
MRNQYGGACYRCGLWVAPGTGYFEKRRDGPGFRVQHCYTKDRGGITCDMAKAVADKAIPPAEAGKEPA